MFNLAGKVALVTGAGRGLGQAIALALAEAGADIAGLGVHSQETTQLRVHILGRRYLPITCDLQAAPVERLEAIVAQVVNEIGRLDILVNNAGTIQRAPLLEYSEAQWDAILQVNLKALFFLSQATARYMVPQGQGKIINIASLLSFQGGIFVPAYTAAKHGVAGLTHALSNELASKGINVNAIAPGYMVTENTAALRADPERNHAILERIPAGRWGLPEDIQGAAVFLASQASDYVHGILLPVDGGWLSR
jgi:2-deoxy-D-gluconate 3-dehydrogenase